LKIAKVNITPQSGLKMSLKTIFLILITSIAAAPNPLFVYCPEYGEYEFLTCDLI
jgi:hypothetical protein